MDAIKHLDQILNQVHSHLKEDLNKELLLLADDTFALHHDRYAQMVDLEQSRHRTLNSLLTVPRSHRVRSAVTTLLKEGQVHERFCSRLNAIENSRLAAVEKQQLLQQLELQKSSELKGLTPAPSLSLEEHTAVLRALIQEAVEIHVEKTLANLQVDLHIQNAS